MSATSQTSSANDRSTFLWGVATSAYQSEGGYNGKNQPQTNWAVVEKLGKVAHTGAAADFLKHHRADFRRAKELGLNAFRLGIEWSRVQPHTEDHAANTPPFDEVAIELYAEMIASCQENGLEPVVTLHHFVHPAWLGQDAWLDPATPSLFEAFVRHAVAGVNRRLLAADRRPIRWFITVNEPNMLVLNTYFSRQFPSAKEGGVRVSVCAYAHLLAAHIRAYNALHDLYAENSWPTPKIAFNTYSSDVYWSEKLLYDLVEFRHARVLRRDLETYICRKAKEFRAAFHNAKIPIKKDFAYLCGFFVKAICNRLGAKCFDPEGFAAALDAMEESPRERVLDYIAIDYYDPFLAHSLRLPRLADIESRDHSLRAWMINSVTSKWWDWRVLPSGLRFFCDYYSREFGLPVLIAENGMALYRSWHNHVVERRDKISRSRFLELFVEEVNRMVDDGIPLLGYLHWSLFDNYEWGSYTPRFGLYSINFSQGTDRLEEDHTGDRPSLTYKRLLETRKGGGS